MELGKVTYVAKVIGSLDTTRGVQLFKLCVCVRACVRVCVCARALARACLCKILVLDARVTKCKQMCFAFFGIL